MYSITNVLPPVKVTIITCTFNSAKTLLWNLESVSRQTYQNIEHIIVDNVSKDDTLQILDQYAHIAKIVSEPDKGIYDGLCKGIKMAEGDIIGILNSDDYLANNDIIEKIVAKFNSDNCDAIYGNLVYVKNKSPDNIHRVWVGGGYNERLFYRGWMPPHPTFYVKKDVYEKFGCFNLSLKYAADYEILLRFLLKYKIRVSVIPEIMVYMRTGGASNKNILRRLVVHSEDYEAWKINGLKPKWYTLWLKPMRKIYQFIVHQIIIKWMVHIPPSHEKDSFMNSLKYKTRLMRLQKNTN